jgi:hypothetical protein
MPGYYVYIMGEDGHVKGRRSIMCKDDETAKEQARQFVDGHAIELWQEARRIATFAPEKK